MLKVITCVMMVTVLDSGCVVRETPVSVQTEPLKEPVTDGVPFSGFIDLTDGVYLYRNVEVLGTLHFSVTPSVESDQTESPLPLYDITVHTDMIFRRTQDFVRKQRWSAGGKSGDRIYLGEQPVLLTRSYRIWSLPKEAYIVISFEVSKSSVGVHGLWVTYDPLPSDPESN